MDNSYFRKIIKKLKNDKEKNKNLIEDYQKKIKLIGLNQFDSKIMLTIFFTVVSFILISLIGLAFPNIVRMTINNFGAQMLPLIIGVPSLGFGAITKKCLYKKNMIKKDFSTISSAKSELEKMEEKVNYEIELNKAENKIDIINKVLMDLNFNQSMFERANTRYNLKDKDDNKSIDELNEEIEKLKIEINKEYEKLNELTLKCNLNYIEFKKNKFNIGNIFSIFVLALTLMFFPSFLIYKFSVINAIPLIIEYLSISAMACLTYCGLEKIKKNNYKKIINKFNNNVEDFKLKDDVQDAVNMDLLMEKQINHISFLIVELEEKKCLYEKKLINMDADENNIKSKDLEKSKEEYSQLSEESTEVVEKGPILVKKLTYKKLTN